MKKILYIIIVSFILFSCTWWNQKVEDAKKEMLWNTWVTNVETKNAEDVIKKEDKVETIVTTNENVNIEYLTTERYISIDPIDEAKLKTWEVEVVWTTLSNNVDRIEVNFVNKESDFPEDNYELKKFKSWDSTFTYVASSRFRVMDFWENIYTFTAYSWDKISKIKLTINLENPEKIAREEVKNNTSEDKIIWVEDDTVFLSLPISEDFWKPIMLGEDVFTYSLIDSLEIKKKNAINITCENLTEYLTENINTWFYWNTCRDIVKEKWISFYIIELKGENYIYEKHYIDFIHWFYWIQWLEKWNWLTSDGLKKKNDELKEKNDYEVIEKTDSLFLDIVNK